MFKNSGILSPILNQILPLDDMLCDIVLVKELAAKWLSQLVGLCRNRKPSPMSKIIKNLCLFACCDPHCTPGMLPPEDRAGSTLSHRKGKTSKSGGPLESQGGARDGGSPPIEADWRENSAWKWNSGIISLVRLKRDVSSRSIVSLW